MKQILKILFLFVFLQSSCSKTESGKNNIQLINYKDILVEKEAANRLLKIYPKATASEGVIALTNTEKPTAVVLIDYEGKFINQIGRQGNGPKEFLSPRFKGFDQDNNIVVRDNSLMLIKKLSLKNELIDTYEDPMRYGLNITSNNMIQCNGYWYLGINHFDKSLNESVPTIGKFNSNFELIKTFGKYDQFFKQKDVLMSPIIDIDCENNIIYTTHYKIPFIQIFKINNDSLMQRIDRVPNSFKISDKFFEIVYNRENYYDMLINEQSTSSDIINNNKYLILVFRDAMSEYFEYRDLKYFNYKLALYSKKDYSYLGEVPINGVPLGSTKEGYIISLINDDPEDFRLRLLDVVVEENDE